MQEMSQTTSRSSIAVVWLAAVLGSVFTGAFSQPNQRMLWTGLTLAACVVLTMCIQLATRQKRGFVDRMTASIVGALVAVVVAGVIFLLA